MNTHIYNFINSLIGMFTLATDIFKVWIYFCEQLWDDQIVLLFGLLWDPLRHFSVCEQLKFQIFEIFIILCKKIYSKNKNWLTYLFQANLGVPSSPKRRKTEINLSSGHPNLLSGNLHRFSNVLPIPVEEDLSLEDFLEVYKKSACPVIIRGTLDNWAALEDGGNHRWSVEYLKKVFHRLGQVDMTFSILWQDI